MGKFLPAKEHFENAVALYDPKHHRPLTFRYGGVDAEVRSLSYVGLTLWQLGYPDQALKRGVEVLALAQRLSHPFSLSFAQSIAGGVLRQLRREVHAVHETAESMLLLSADHGLANPRAYATVFRGWALAEQGRHQEGIARYRKV